MGRRRRRPAMLLTHREAERGGERQAQSVARRQRRPSRGYVAGRPRTVNRGPRHRLRGIQHDLEPGLPLGICETDGFAQIDEIVVVGPCLAVGRSAPQAPAVDPQRELSVLTDLQGRRLPSLELEWMPGEWLDLRALAAKPLVLYLQPGAATGVRVVQDEEDETSLGADAAQSRGFAERALELAAMNHRVVGVSSQSAARHLTLAVREALPHVVLSDSRLELAEEMGLPTFESEGVCLYERLTLIIRQGRVEKVFYPILNPAAHAAEVAQWLRDGER